METNGFLGGKAQKTDLPVGVKKMSTSPPKSPIFDFGRYTIGDLGLPTAVCVTTTTSCAEAAKIMQEHNFDQVPVITAPQSPSKSSNQNSLVGLVTLGNILARVAHGRASLSDPVMNVMFKFDKKRGFKEITVDTALKDLTTFFDTNSAAVVTDKQNNVVKHVVTKFDLVAFMVKQTTSPVSPKAKKTKHF